MGNASPCSARTRGKSSVDVDRSTRLGSDARLARYLGARTGRARAILRKPSVLDRRIPTSVADPADSPRYPNIEELVVGATACCSRRSFRRLREHRRSPRSGQIAHQVESRIGTRSRTAPRASGLDRGHAATSGPRTPSTTPRSSCHPPSRSIPTLNFSLGDGQIAHLSGGQPGRPGLAEPSSPGRSSRGRGVEVWTRIGGWHCRRAPIAPALAMQVWAAPRGRLPATGSPESRTVSMRWSWRSAASTPSFSAVAIVAPARRGQRRRQAWSIPARL